MSMVHATVRLGDPIWRQAGKKEITVALALGATEADLVDVLVDLYPELSSFLTDAELPLLAIREEELIKNDTVLADGDTIMFVLRSC